MSSGISRQSEEGTYVFLRKGDKMQEKKNIMDYDTVA